MKKFIYFILLFQVTTLSAQVDSKYLVNEWYLAKVEMKDGSSIFLKPLNYLTNHGLRITKKYYQMAEIRRLMANSTLPIQYTQRGNELVTAPDSKLLIEKLSADSLILSQVIKNMEDKDLLRYYLVPLNKMMEQKKAAFAGKDTLIANEIISPVYLGIWPSRTVRNITDKNKFTVKPVLDYRFNGAIIIDLEHKKATVNLLDFDPKNKNLIDEKLKSLTVFKNWNISDFKDYKFVKIPFSFIHYYEKEPTVESFGDVLTFYSDDYKGAFIKDDVDFDEIDESNKHFDRAIKEYQKKNYKAAVDYFEKSFKANKRNLNSYYNFADLNFAIGNKEIACETYKFLKDEGQKQAEKDYNLKCLK